MEESVLLKYNPRLVLVLNEAENEQHFLMFGHFSPFSPNKNTEEEEVWLREFGRKFTDFKSQSRLFSRGSFKLKDFLHTQGHLSFDQTSSSFFLSYFFINTPAAEDFFMI